MTQHMNKTTLINNIQTRQTEFEQFLAALNETQMTTPGVTGTWSIKDIVAHLVTWQKVALNRLQAAIHDTEPTAYPDEDIDTINERLYQENKSRSLSDVLTDFHKTYLQVIEAVQAVSEDDLNNPHRFSWWRGEPLWPNVAGNTYEHIDEHIGSIQDWLAKQQ